MSGRKQSQQRTPLFDHLVGAGEEGRWKRKAEPLRSFEIDLQRDPCRLLDRISAGLAPLRILPTNTPARLNMSNVLAP